MEDPRRAMADDPLRGESQQREWTIAVRAPLRRPIRLTKEGPPVRQRMHAIVREHDVPVIVRELVRDADGRREERQREERGGEQEPTTFRHQRRLYRMMCHNAATPSFQLIFLPSAYVRPE